jgi:hypothetical protein
MRVGPGREFCQHPVFAIRAAANRSFQAPASRTAPQPLKHHAKRAHSPALLAQGNLAGHKWKTRQDGKKAGTSTKSLVSSYKLLNSKDF